MLALLLSLACQTGPADPPVREGLEPTTVPALTEELGATRSRPRIYNYWATWCGPCIQELPTLRDWARTHDGAELILVNVDHPSLRESQVRAAVARLDLQGFRNLAVEDEDPAYALMALEGWPQSVPVTMVVSASGERVRQFNVRVNASMLDRAVAEAAAAP